MNNMRKNIGAKEDDEALIRQFCNGFEYLFGESDDDNESDLECAQPLLRKKTCNSSVATATNRPINTTFSYTSSDPTVFKAKLNFISTKDVMKVMIDGSKDFCASKARARCRLLQRPEMWDRLLEKKETITGAEYESMIYQLMEFRLLFEYLNGGAGGPPFQNIKKSYPTDEEKWLKKEMELSAMEAGADMPAVATVVESPVLLVKPKRDRKKKVLERIALQLRTSQEAKAATHSSSESESSDTDGSDRRVEKSDTGTSSSTIEAVMTPVTARSEEEDGDGWIEVGPPKRTAQVPETKSVVDRQRLYENIRNRCFKSWIKIHEVYRCASTGQVAVIRNTFINIIPMSDLRKQTRECPF